MNAVNDAITAQGAGVRSVALAMHVYGDNAERVLRFALLTAKTKAELEDRMVKQGNIIGPDSISLLQQTELMVNRIGLAFEGVVTKAIIAFGPLVLSALEIGSQFLAGFQTDKMLADIRGFALSAAALILNLPSYFRIASDYIVLAIGRIGEAFDTLAIRMYRFQADLADILRNGDVRDSSNKKANDLEAAIAPTAKREVKPWYSRMADDAVSDISRVKDALITTDQLQSMIAGRTKLGLLQQVPYDLYEKMLGMMRSKKLLVDGALQTAREVEQPFEKLQARLRSLDLMKGIKDNMSMETYGRAVLKAFNEIESGLQLTDIRLPGLARKDSAEAVSAINRSEVEYKMKIADTPAVRQQRILEQSYEVLLLIKDYAAKSAEAAVNRKTVSVGP